MALPQVYSNGRMTNHIHTCVPGDRLELKVWHQGSPWSTADMRGYLRTWSACKRYEEQNGSDPVQHIAGRLEATWGGDRRVVRWPLRMRASRV